MSNNTNNHPIVSLATRELEVYHMLAKGMKTSEIAKALSLKANTISTIKKVIFKKLGISSIFELYKLAENIKN
jgi:DNA-binding NarL/FixJ family response regulator